MPYSPNDITKAERNLLWNRFEHEEGLMSELEYYQDKVKRMPAPATALDHAVLDAFYSHIGNLERLLEHLYDRNPPALQRRRFI